MIDRTELLTAQRAVATARHHLSEELAVEAAKILNGPPDVAALHILYSLATLGGWRNVLPGHILKSLHSYRDR